MSALEEFHAKALTVEQLIVELQKLPKHMIVLMEGCDCYQEAAQPIVQDEYVLIRNFDALEKLRQEAEDAD